MDYRGININDEVLIKLTERGREILKQRNEKYKLFMRAYYPNVDMGDYRPKEEDVGGWSKWQLWMLMETFGSYMGNGFPVPFETTIRIVLKD